MFPGLHWLLRMKRWQQNPPSMGRVLLVLGVIAACLALIAVERWLGWPDALTPTKVPGPRLF